MLRLAFVVLIACALDAQPAFDAASVKASTAAEFNRQIDAGRYAIAKATLNLLITEAYSVQWYQISGGPAWMDSAEFDIQGAAKGTNTPEQIHQMLQTLLTSRFKLALHRETKEVSGYSLLADKRGTKLRPSKELSTLIGLRPLTKDDGRSIRVILQKATLPSLANYVSLWVAAPVIDATGLAGSYDFLGEVTLASPFDRLTVWQEILPITGLRLETTRVPTEVLVIDHAEKPSAD